MEQYDTKKNFFYLFIMILLVLSCWLIGSFVDIGQNENNVIHKESLRLQVNYPSSNQ